MIQSLGSDFDSRIRAAAMAWLRQRCTPENPVVRREELLDFHFEGRRFPLIDNQLGIRKPQQLSEALSILTTYTSDGKRAPYEDALGPDGLLRYKYQGRPDHYTNVGLRRAFELQVPLLWFFGVAQGMYLPSFPVWIVADEPEESQVAVALDEAQQPPFGASQVAGRSIPARTDPPHRPWNRHRCGIAWVPGTKLSPHSRSNPRRSRVSRLTPPVSPPPTTFPATADMRGTG